MSKIKILLNENQYKFLTEGRIDFLRNQYVGKQPKDVSKQQLIDDETFNKIVTADPSKNLSYSDWLLTLYRWKQLPLEDLYKVTEYLQIFDKFKNKMPEKDISRKDGNNYYYSSLQKLFSVVRPYMEGNSEESMGNSALIKKIKNEESEKYYEDDEWLVVIPKTERASCLYGKNTQWCTATDKADNEFDDYKIVGDLYINIHKPTNKKYQFVFEMGSFKDEWDTTTTILFYNATLLRIYSETQLQLVKYVDWSNMNLSSLPKSIEMMSELETFDLSDNNFSSKEQKKIIKLLPYTNIEF